MANPLDQKGTKFSGFALGTLGIVLSANFFGCHHPLVRKKGIQLNLEKNNQFQPNWSLVRVFQDYPRKVLQETYSNSTGLQTGKSGPGFKSGTRLPPPPPPLFFLLILSSSFVSFYPSIFSSFNPFFLQSFLPSILSSFNPFFLQSFLPSILSSFNPFFLQSFLPSILSSLYPSSSPPPFFFFFPLHFVYANLFTTKLIIYKKINNPREFQTYESDCWQSAFQHDIVPPKKY